MDHEKTQLFLVAMPKEQKILYSLSAGLLLVLGLLLTVVHPGLLVVCAAAAIFLFSYAACQIQVFEDYVVVRKIFWVTKRYEVKNMKIYVMSFHSLMKLDSTNEMFSCCVYDLKTKPMFRFSLGKGAMDNSDALLGYLKRKNIYERHFDA